MADWVEICNEIYTGVEIPKSPFAPPQLAWATDAWATDAWATGAWNEEGLKVRPKIVSPWSETPVNNIGVIKCP